jgi:hypothetical protein
VLVRGQPLLLLLAECIVEGVAGDHWGEGDDGVASGCDYERVGVVGLLSWWVWRLASES